MVRSASGARRDVIHCEVAEREMMLAPSAAARLLAIRRLSMSLVRRELANVRATVAQASG